MAVFWVDAPCSLVEVYRRLKKVALTMEAESTAKTLVTSTRLHGANNSEDIHLEKVNVLVPDTSE
jgi:hypothetical protein